MLTSEDIKKIVEVVATKEDIKDLEQDIDGLRESVQALVLSVDKLVKSLDRLETEYAAITNQISRHEKWIQQLAQRLNVKLGY